MDHVNANALSHSGYSAEEELLVVSDLASGHIGAYPMGAKTSGRVLRARTHFLGHDQPRDFYTGRAPELIAAVQSFPGGPNPRGTSISGVPQTNGIAKSRVKKVIRGAQALLLQAGLPHAWWPYAPRCFAAIHNFVTGDDGPPFGHRHGGHLFSGPLIPCGALAHALPSALHNKRNLKCEPTLKPAVFLGYVVQDGGKWYAEYLWAFVEAFAGRCF